MIVELYAVAWQYRDSDNRDAHGEPFTPWFLDEQQAQTICDRTKPVDVYNVPVIVYSELDNGVT